ncbi:MAG: AraC family transcriptional regulator [Sulfurovum sp.]|nr:AraC family transcriptional regulator [Sulfurovum sp.]
MTYIVPNHFLQKHPHAVISSDSLFTLTYSTQRTQEKIAVRSTTHVMILIIQGSKRLTSKNTDIMLGEGDILLLTQGNYFMSEIINEAGTYQALMVYFNDDFIMNFIAKYHLDLKPYRSLDVVSFSCDTFLSALIHSYTLQANQKLDYQNEIIKLKTQEMFLHLLQTQNKVFGAFLKTISLTSKERIKHILEANIDLLFSVEDMSKIASVSKSELRHAMQKSFGMQPKAWLNSKRMEEAGLLLSNTEQSITAIATTCGYSTASWFGVQFKKVLWHDTQGLSPTKPIVSVPFLILFRS